MSRNRFCWAKTKPGLVFYCCVANYHKFGSLKQHAFIFSQFCGQKSRKALLDSCLGFRKTEVRALTRLISGGSGKEPAPKLIQVVCRVHFLQTVGLRGLFHCWLSTGTTLNSSSQESLPCDPLHLSNKEP